MKLARFLILSVVVLFALHCSRSAFVSFIGIDPKYYFGLIAVPVLVIATFRYHRYLGQVPTFMGYSMFLVIMLGSIVVLTAVGFAHGNLPQLILFDIGSLLILWCFLFLGRYDQVWHDLEKPLFVLLAIFAPFILIGLSRPEVQITFGGIVEQEIGKGSRWTVNTLAYNTRELLHIVPLCFALACTYVSWNWSKIVGIAGMAYWFGLMLAFAKRGPAVQAIAYALWSMLLLSRIKRKVQLGLTSFIILISALVIIFVGGVRIAAIFERYQETGNFFSNERYYEVGLMFDDFNIFDYVTGRGMGGYFNVPADWEAGVEYVTSSGHKGRPHIHVGIFWPFLKGGVLFTVIYMYMFMGMLLPKGRGWINDKYNFVALANMAVFGTFLVIHTAPTLSGPLQLMVVGLCCARFGIPAKSGPRYLAA